MFEEIIAFLLSLFSAFTADLPNVSRGKAVTRSNGYYEGNDDNKNLRCVKYGSTDNVFRSQRGDVPTVARNDQNTSTLGRSLFQSLKTNFYIISAIFLSASIAILFVWFDLRTNDLCFEWKNHGNNTIPFSVLRVKLIGNGIQTIILVMWFPGSLILLFGWHNFRRYYSSTIVVALLTGLTITLYFCIYVIVR